MSRHTDKELADLLGALAPAPEAWVEAAKMLPRIQAGADEVVERAERDPAFRRSAIALTSKALAEARAESQRRTLQGLLARLEALDDGNGPESANGA